MLIRKYRKTKCLLFLIGIVPVFQIISNLDIRPQKKRIIVTGSRNIKLLLENDSEQPDLIEVPENNTEEIVLDSDDEEEIQRRRKIKVFDEEPSMALKLYQKRLRIASYFNSSLIHSAGLFSNLTVWSLNDQQGMAEDLYLLFKKFQVKLYHFQLQSLCWEFPSCPSELKGISGDQLSNVLSNIEKEFQAFLLTIPEFVKSDIVLCLSPASLCKVYQNLNKTVIIYITEKYNTGILQPKIWKIWNVALKIINKQPQNSILASDVYNVQYFNYFTSLEPRLIQPYAGYMNVPNQLVTHENTAGIVPFENKNLMKNFYHGLYKKRNQFEQKLDLTEYKLSVSQIIRYKLVVYLPSRISSLRFVELYRQNVPLFVPSLELLTRWHLKERVFNHNSKNPASSYVSKGSAVPGVISLPDPNNERESSSVGFWLQFMDIYSFPHVLYFSSIEDLIQKLLTVDEFKLVEISRTMKQYNIKQMSQVENDWSTVFTRHLQSKSIYL